MNSKDFHIGDILSITTGRLVSLRHMDGVYDILNWMTGDNLSTIQLGRASDECKPWLLRQHPQLAAIVVPELTLQNWRAWLNEMVAKYGEALAVEQIPEDDHERIDPLTELQRLRPDFEATVVVLPR
jgi:hypothetical protein